jgi:hypothetical protein
MDSFRQDTFRIIYFDQVRYNGNVDAGRKTIDNTFQLSTSTLVLCQVTAVLAVKITRLPNGETSERTRNLSFFVEVPTSHEMPSMAVGLTYRSCNQGENLALGLRTGFITSTFYPCFSISTNNKFILLCFNGNRIRTNEHSNFFQVIRG